MKYLGIDYGQKRVGLALSSKDERVLLPYKTLLNSSKKQVVKDLKKIIEVENIDAVVVGLPIGLDGERTLSTRQVENFIKELEKSIDVPLYVVDESYTSYEAEDKLRRAGVSAKKMKKVIDQIAAMEILNTFLLNRP